jgi:hypothetical protein
MEIPKAGIPTFPPRGCYEEISKPDQFVRYVPSLKRKSSPRLDMLLTVKHHIPSIIY